MSTLVRELLEGKARALTVRQDESVKHALSLMIKHDYSQLPVIDDAERPIALVTSHTIMRALSHFDVTVNDLRIFDVMDQRITKVDLDDELFDILDQLQRLPAVLVIDSAGKLNGILTTHDATEHLRQRVQDIMLVQDIEEMVKEYIQDALRPKAGTLDDGRLNDVIAKIAPSNKRLNKPFREALKAYLNAKSSPDILDEKVADQVFQEHLHRPGPLPTFEELTLADYIQMLLHEHCWSQYQPLFSIDQKALRRLLDEVRKTRNDLSHLRSDISDEQRDRLQYCKDWLSRHQNTDRFDDGGLGAVSEDHASATEQVSAKADVHVADMDELIVLSGVRDSDETRYFPLLRHLYSIPMDRDRIRLSFAEVENIIGGKLPPSARAHRAWWSDNRVHTHAGHWLDAGWRVGRVSMTDEHVTFMRNKERERLYTDFFNELLKEIRQQGDWPNPLPSPTGQSWISLARLQPQGEQVAILTCSFTRRKRFTIGLYIDTGDQQRNKGIFDRLVAHKSEIEAQLGEVLDCERLDRKRASRISVSYHEPVTIEQPSQFEPLRRWVAAQLKRFYEVMTSRLVMVAQ